MSEPTKSSLYRKIAEIAASIEAVSKDGYNPQLKYKYATPATIMEAVKPLLAAHTLAIVPMVNQVIKESTGGKTQSGAEKVITRVEMTYLILDGESGESLACTWAGEGEDWSDKGIAKAQTIALRTFLIQLFQIPSGDDDPDASQPQRGGATYQQPAKRPEPAPAPRKQPDRDEYIDRLKTLWNTEKQLGGATPAAELAIDLDDEQEATIDQIVKLGKAAAARVKRLQEQEVAP